MMRLKFCLLFLCFLAATIVVQSETRIEVDENGDEYEVKRFNIEGRQLGSGRSQCVETRRKRSTPQSADDGQNENDDSGDRKQSDGVTTSVTTPASGIDTNTNGDEVDNGDKEYNKETDDNDSYNNENAEEPNEEGEIDAVVPGNNEDYDYENAEHEQQEHAPISIIAQHLGETPQVAQTNNEHIQHDAGVVVVQSHVPPQVNPQTHAVFQLLPVNNAINAAIDYGADGEVLHYNEDVSPVTTTAIWSTGDDGAALAGDEYDYDDFKKKPGSSSSSSSSSLSTKKKKRRKPSNSGSKKKGNKNKNKKNKNKNKNKNKKNKNKNKNKKNKNKHRRPSKKTKLPSNGIKRKSNKRRRRPSFVPQRVSSNTNKDRNQDNNADNSANNNSQNSLNVNNSNRNTVRRGNKNQDLADKGTRTFSKTETLTQTGTGDQNKELNCIIIRKDPPPTTRPFWNILGRNAVDSSNASRSNHFGKRKRINLRFAS